MRGKSKRKPHVLPEVTEEFVAFYDCSDKGLSFEESNPILAELEAAQARYVEFSEIGRGGMKTVSRVYDSFSGRYVALAQLHEEAPKEAYEAFLREARLTAGLQHPNIIPVYDVGMLEGAPYFTMELKSGSTLAELLGEDDLPRRRALEIFLKVCDAVGFAHSLSVVHLDLKPANVQVGEYGEVMVCDWGLGKIIGEEGEQEPDALCPDTLNAMTLAGRIKGTPGYMAPEQIKGGGGKDRRTDVFALGAVLHALLVGRRSEKAKLEAVFEKTLNGTLCSFDHGKGASSVPKSLKAVVAKATEVDSEKRYATVEDLSCDVRSYLEGFPTAAENAGFGTQLLMLFKRNKLLSATMFLTSFLTLGLTFYAFNEIRQSAEDAREARVVAESERDAARAAFDKYAQEKRYSTELAESFEAAVLGQSLLFVSSGLYSNRTTVGDFERVIAELDKIIAKDPDHAGAVEDKGKLLVVMQRFEESAACYAQDPDAKELVIGLVNEFAEKYPGSERKSPEILAEFIGELRERFPDSRKPLAEKIMAFDALARSDLTRHSVVVREALRMFNQSWDGALFRYDEKARSLRVGGRGLETFLTSMYHTSYSNLLRTLKIDTLAIEGPDFVSLENVSKLPLTTLDISRTAVRRVPEVEDLKLISEIVCREGQFSAEEKSKFPAHLRIVEK